MKNKQWTWRSELNWNSSSKRGAPSAATVAAAGCRQREREGEGESEMERRGVARRRLSSSSWPPLWAIQQSVWFSPVFIFNTRQLKMLTWSGHNQVPREGWGWRCGCGWVVWCISLALLFVWITRDTHSQHSVFCAQLSFLCARLWLCCAVCAISVSAFHLLGI